MKVFETVEYRGCYLDIYKSNGWFEKIYTGTSDSFSFYSHSTDKDLVIARFKEAVDKRLENFKTKATVEDVDKKIAELVKEIAYLNKKLEEKDKKIERLKNKIATVKFEINKAE